MSWSEQWPIVATSSGAPTVEPRAIARRVEAALAARGVAPGIPIAYETGELDGARLDVYGRYVTVTLGVALGTGELRGALTFARAEGDDPAYAEFAAAEARGPWEPLYRLFAELALGLGAAPEPVLAPAVDADELREDVRATVEACVTDAMFEDGLEPGTAAIVLVPGEAPLDAFELAVEHLADASLVRVTGAGGRFEVLVRGPASELSQAARAAIERALRDDLGARLGFHRWIRHQRAAPRPDPARGGKLILERRASGGAVRGAAELRTLDELRAALTDGDADVIRYFASGAPFWKSSYELGQALDEHVRSLDDLHADRTWQWDPATG